MTLKQYTLNEYSDRKINYVECISKKFCSSDTGRQANSQSDTYIHTNTHTERERERERLKHSRHLNEN